MAQITIYMDEKTLKKVEVAARKEHDSVSKWIKKRIIKDLESTWPPKFFELFGALKDETFVRPAQPNWSDDRKRQEL